MVGMLASLSIFRLSFSLGSSLVVLKEELT
jgi:hypothetical protein